MASVVKVQSRDSPGIPDANGALPSPTIMPSNGSEAGDDLAGSPNKTRRAHRACLQVCQVYPVPPAEFT